MKKQTPHSIALCLPNKYVLIFIFIGLFSAGIQAQDNEQSPHITLEGVMGITYNNYQSSVTNEDWFRPRYPSDLYRFNLDASLRIGKYFNIPFGVNISNQDKTYNLPTLPEEGVYNYIRNPRNNVHIDPTYKWIRASLGSHTPQYSEFTSGDMQLFGAGIDLNPGKFILSASYGVSQYAVEPDPDLRIAGAYEQKLWSGRIGVGKLNGNKFTFNIVKLQDDAHSLTHIPDGVTPHEGISFAPMFELKITKNLKLKSEIAASVFTDDVLADDSFLEEVDLTKVDKIITINNTSVLDYAHLNSIRWDLKNFGIGAEVKYVGPGFMSVGYRNIEKDIIDYKLLTDFKLFKNKLIVNSTVGLRTNNISKTKLDKNRRVIGNVNMMAQFSKKFSLNLNYSNFGFRNNRHENLYRIEMVSNSFSVTPTYIFSKKTNVQQISTTLSFDRFSQYDIYSHSTLETENKVLQANYLISFKKSGLNLLFFGMYLDNHSDLYAFQMQNGGLNIGYPLFKKKMKLDLYATYIRMERQNFTPDNRLNFKMRMRYKIGKKTHLNMSFSQNNNRYGSYRPGAEVQENRFEISLTQKF